MPEGRNLPDSSLPGLRIPHCVQGQIHRELGAWHLNARERRSSPASLLAHEGLLFFMGLCEGYRAAAVALRVTNLGAPASVPGAVSPWLRGFSRPLLPDTPATGSSSAQRPCRGPPGPGPQQVGRIWGWSQEWLLQPCTGEHRESLLQTPSCLSQPRDAQRGDDGGGRLRQDGARRRRWRFLGPAANPLAAPAVLCAGSPGWHLPGLAGATATGLAGFASLLPRCAGGTGLRWLWLQ